MKRALNQRSIRSGIDRIERSERPPRHQHADAYATVVLEGAYEQFAYAGRLQVAAGDVLIQPTFDCHADRMLSAAVRLIRLPWRRDAGLGGVHRGVRLDEIVRAAETDAVEASDMLSEALAGRFPAPAPIEDWPDLLARELASDRSCRIGAWAQARGVPRESLTRAFGAVFETSPLRFRLELRARGAWARLTACDAPLAEIALDLGFADQSHMTRAVKWLTGRTPAAWRAVT